MFEKEKNKVIEAIKSGNRKVLKNLYDEHRQSFIIWSYQRYQCEENEAIELYQKAYTILYMNVRDGKLTSLTSTVRTYLFSIGKNLFRERQRERSNATVNLDDVSNSIKVSKEIDSDILSDYQNQHQKKLVRELLSNVGEPCQTLLQLIFIRGFSAEAVANEMGYSDERVVRKRKSLCLKKLREMVAEKNGSNFY